MHRPTLHRPTQERQHIEPVAHARRTKHCHRTRPTVPRCRHTRTLHVQQRHGRVTHALLLNHTRPAGGQHGDGGGGGLLHQRLHRFSRHGHLRLGPRDALGQLCLNAGGDGCGQVVRREGVERGIDGPCGLGGGVRLAGHGDGDVVVGQDTKAGGGGGCGCGWLG